MRTSAAGNKVAGSTRRRDGGFTLLELLVVVTIMAMASAGVMFAMRDGAATRLEHEAQRLAALLDSARALSRASGIPVRWRPTAQGFAFEGLPAQALPSQWLSPQTLATLSAPLVLGPEPIIGPQVITLRSSEQPALVLQVRTDGLGPFEVRSPGASNP